MIIQDDSPERFKRLTRHLKIGMPGQRQPIEPMPRATCPEAEALRAQRAKKETVG